MVCRESSFGESSSPDAKSRARLTIGVTDKCRPADDRAGEIRPAELKYAGLSNLYCS